MRSRACLTVPCHSDTDAVCEGAIVLSQNIPLTLLRRFLRSEAAEESAPAIFGGNKSTAIDQMPMATPQMTKPSHQAPIHRGSRWSMSGSEYVHSVTADRNHACRQ